MTTWRAAAGAVVLVGAVATLAGCRSTAIVETGNEVEEGREVAAFTELSVDAAVVATVRPGEEPGVVVRADEAVVDRVVTEVDGDRLRVDLRLRPGEVLRGVGVEVDVTVPGELTALDVDAAAVARGEDALSAERLEVSADAAARVSLPVAVDELEVAADAGSQVELTGGADTVEIEADAASQVQLGDVEARTVTVDADAASEVTVRVSESLTGQADAGARVVYLGDPDEVDVSADGAASVSRG